MVTATVDIKPPPRANRLWTFEEVLAELPESNQRVELWDGELIMSPSPCPSHQKIVLRLARLMQDFVEPRQLGDVFVSPLDVVFSPRRAAQPDVIFVSRANRGIIQDRIRGAPDLVVEVISAGTGRRDRIEKKALYAEYRVPEYWIIDPEIRTIEVLVLRGSHYQVHSRAEGGEAAASQVLSGFALAFGQVEI